MLELVYIFVFKGVNSKDQRAVVKSDGMNLNVVGCGSYEEAEQVAVEMVQKGCPVIELCPGFGHEGVARIQKAVGPGIPVGVVRFDLHPAIDSGSGDSLFGSRA